MWRGLGAFGLVALLATPIIRPSTDNFIALGTGAVARQKQDKLRDIISVKDFGAVGDGVADDTAAVQAALTAASASGSPDATVNFPAGTYRISSTLTVTASGVSLVGENRKGDGGGGRRQGPELRGVTSGMGPVLRVNSPGVGNYGFQLRSIKFTGQAGLGTAPKGLELKDISEFVIDNAYFGGGLGTCLWLNGATLGTIKGGDWSDCDIGIDFYNDGTPVVFSQAAVAVWVQNVDIWNSTTAAIRMYNSTVFSVSFKDSWIEYTPNAFLITHSGANVSVTDVAIDGVHYSNGSGSPHLDGRFFRATAQSTASWFMDVDRVSFRRVRADISQTVNSAYAVEVLKGSNTHATTSATRFTIADSFFNGPTTAMMNTDLAVNVSIIGNVDARNVSNATIPHYTDASGRYAAMYHNPTTGLWQTTTLSAYGTGDQTLNFKSNNAAGSATVDFVFDTANTRTGGGYIWQTKNNGGIKFGVTTAGNILANTGTGSVFAAIFSAANSSNSTAFVNGSRTAADTGADVVAQSTITRTAGSLFAAGNNGTTKALINFDGGLQQTGVTFANLTASPSNGTLLYCSDCTIANPCASGGTGAFAKRLNSVWVCN